MFFCFFLSFFLLLNDERCCVVVTVFGEVGKLQVVRLSLTNTLCQCPGAWAAVLVTTQTWVYPWMNWTFGPKLWPDTKCGAKGFWLDSSFGSLWVCPHKFVIGLCSRIVELALLGVLPSRIGLQGCEFATMAFALFCCHPISLSVAVFHLNVCKVTCVGCGPCTSISPISF